MPKSEVSPFEIARRRAVLRRKLLRDIDKASTDRHETDEILDRAVDRTLEATCADASARRSAR